MLPIRSTVPTQRRPFVMWGLIGANTAIFLWQLGLGHYQQEWVFRNLAVIPGLFFERIADGGGTDPATYLPLISNTFLHGGWIHLILNMWTLWLFGPAVEDRLGHARFCAFYLVCGVIVCLCDARPVRCRLAAARARCIRSDRSRARGLYGHDRPWPSVLLLSTSAINRARRLWSHGTCAAPRPVP